MTWRTQLGERHAIGPEATLIRSAIAFMHDLVEAEVRYRDDSWSFGVPVFDNLEPASKLSLLADVGEALLNETPLPPLTAIKEGAVAAIFGAIRQLIELEIDVQKGEEAAPDGDDRCFYRKLVLEIANSDEDEVTAVEEDIDDEEGMPSAESTDMSDWEWLMDAISERILWDEDYLYADELLDAAPEQARRERRRLGIARDYYLDVPPDPEETDLELIRKRLEKLTCDKTQ
jgi:hypothetical protein